MNETLETTFDLLTATLTLIAATLPILAATGYWMGWLAFDDTVIAMILWTWAEAMKSNSHE